MFAQTPPSKDSTAPRKCSTEETSTAMHLGSSSYMYNSKQIWPWLKFATIFFHPTSPLNEPASPETPARS
jgi:hypothetical protein